MVGICDEKNVANKQRGKQNPCKEETSYHATFALQDKS
jgi:hypothetical protein